MGLKLKEAEDEAQREKAIRESHWAEEARQQQEEKYRRKLQAQKQLLAMDEGEREALRATAVAQLTPPTSREETTFLDSFEDGGEAVIMEEMLNILSGN